MNNNLLGLENLSFNLDKIIPEIPKEDRGKVVVAVAILGAFTIISKNVIEMFGNKKQG